LFGDLLLFVNYRCSKANWAIEWEKRKVKGKNGTTGTGTKIQDRVNRGIREREFGASERKSERRKTGKKARCV
jgi:hypothetical protein